MLNIQSIVFKNTCSGINPMEHNFYFMHKSFNPVSFSVFFISYFGLFASISYLFSSYVNIFIAKYFNKKNLFKEFGGLAKYEFIKNITTAFNMILLLVVLTSFVAYDKVFAKIYTNAVYFIIIMLFFFLTIFEKNINYSFVANILLTISIIFTFNSYYKFPILKSFFSQFESLQEFSISYDTFVKIFYFTIMVLFIASFAKLHKKDSFLSF